MAEGVIKYNYKFIQEELIGYNTEPIIELRQRLFSLNLIGVDHDGFGFGNISHRIDGNSFLITASQTGCLNHISSHDLTLITHADIANNMIECKGMKKPSSEALAHYAVYSADPNIDSVIHTHHLHLWKKLLGKLPSTSEMYKYGTPQLAQEIFKIVKTNRNNHSNTIILGGHKAGIITYGPDYKSSFQSLIKLLYDL